MRAKIQLEIVTPDKLLFTGEVDEVTVPGAGGYFGILPGHAPLLSELKIGVLSYHQNGEEKRLFCSWGFVEVLPESVSVLAEQALSPQDIDEDQAEIDRDKAQQILQSPQADTDYAQALSAFEEARTRLQVCRD
ncbi:MAG: F0F1 ATP synthase subunit epsilon [Acidobacteriota bacterium]